MPWKILMAASIGLASPLAAAADPLDCNDMASVVSEMLVDHMRIPQYLGLGTAEAADITFRMNYFHAKRQEYNRTFCSAVITLDSTRFAKAERRAGEMNGSQALQGLVEVAGVGGLARYEDLPAGVKVLFRLELIGNDTTWVVTLPGDPAMGHICSLPDRDRYLEDGRPCSSPLREELLSRRAGAVDTVTPNADTR